MQDTLSGSDVDSGFSIVDSRDASEKNLAFSARSRALVERGEKPPHRAVQLIHGDLAVAAMANTIRAVKESRLVPIEVICKKSGDAWSVEAGPCVRWRGDLPASNYSRVFAVESVFTIASRLSSTESPSHMTSSVWS